MIKWKDKAADGVAKAVEHNAALEGMLITGNGGFVAGTRVATSAGWRVAEKLRVGDKVLTFDHGMRPIVDIQRETVNVEDGYLPAAQRPVMVPEHALHNSRALWLMPEQGMLVESEATLDMLGDPFAIVPARALQGFRGINSGIPEGGLQVTTVAFAHDEVIYVEGGLLAFCPEPRCILTEGISEQDDLYNLLPMSEARPLVEALIALDDAEALSCDVDELVGIPDTVRPNRPMLL
ncbi:Hint domain-containing protein [Primorskyibacter sp. S87]|uniref:Hint domain-containing protein n=1 Tax=Primorskyibacter sp. S87 TaxID=3415126 RepID=UPI003C7B8647